MIKSEMLSGELGLIPGWHATKEEVDFTSWVIRERIRPLFSGSLKLIGSRSALEPWWISFNRFQKAAKIVSPDWSNEEILSWAIKLNRIARENKMCRREIHGILSHLRHPPRAVISFLEGNYGVPGSDIDIMLNIRRRPEGLMMYYEDAQKTGQLVDILYIGEIRQLR